MRWRSLGGMVAMAAIAACDRCGSRAAEGSGEARPTSTATSAVTARNVAPSNDALTFEVREVHGRRYRLFGPGSGWRWAITNRRPEPSDRRLAFAVAGTYTRSDDEIEGLFVVDGVVEHDEATSWEGMLVVEEGRARLERVASGTIDATAREVVASGGSLLQGHLLVDEAVRLPLKDSASLQRRAFVELAGRRLVVESFGAVPLRGFADDLVMLGASRALNLDMGKWSGGWYRTHQGGHAPLGNDHRATARQSNWVVIWSG